MITGLKVETKHDNIRVLHAIKENRKDQCQYLIEFTPNKSSLNIGSGDIKGRTILNSAGPNDPNLISFDVSLKRGLYDVDIAKVTKISGREIETDSETQYRYPDPVMVGENYVVKAKKENTVCYGVPGVRVRIASVEMPLDSHTVYYMIKKENIDHIKYYVPFNQSDRIDFFIKGVKKDEIELFLGNPSFQIEGL